MSNVELPELTVFMYPGQGSQEPGMPKKAIESVAAAREVFNHAAGYASDRMKRDIGKLMLEGSKEDLSDTRISQPAIFIASITGSTALREILGRDASRRIGHSFGNFAALHDDGVFSTETGIDLAIARAEFMHQEALDRPGAMAAVLKLAEDKVSEICAKTGAFVANDNSDTEIIISGEEKDVDNSREHVEKSGGRFIKLPIRAGAPHTPLMKGAADKMVSLVDRIPGFHVPEGLSVMSSRTVELLKGLGDIKADITGLTERVQWNNSVKRLVADGYREFYETGPGQKLSKLPKRAPEMADLLMQNSVIMLSLDEVIDKLAA